MADVVFFTAQLDTNVGSDGSINPTNANLPHSPSNVRKHIQTKSSANPQQPQQTPYCSLALTIASPLIKYSYGKKRGEVNKKNKMQFSVNRNQERTRIFMVVADKMHEAGNIEEQPIQGQTTYYPGETFHKHLSKQFRNGSQADREVLVYGAIDPGFVFEVHPLLADILFILSFRISEYENDKKNNGQLTDEASRFKARYEEVYKSIIDKIESGECSVDNINRMIKEFKMNTVERSFVQQFYIERINIFHSCLGAIPEIVLSGNLCQDDEQVVITGTCLRNQVLEDIFPQFMKRLFPKIKTVEKGICYIPNEEDVRASTQYRLNGETHKIPNAHVVVPGQIISENYCSSPSSESYKCRISRRIPKGMSFKCDYEGNPFVITEIFDIREKDDGEVKKTGYNETRDVKRISKIYQFDNLSEQEAKKAREAYLAKKKEAFSKSGDKEGARKFFREYIDDNNQLSYVSFDEEGYCLIIDKKYIQNRRLFLENNRLYER